MNLRDLTVLILIAVAITTLTIATLAPAWDVIRLVGLTAIAVVAIDLLSRGGDLPRPDPRTRRPDQTMETNSEERNRR